MLRGVNVVDAEALEKMVDAYGLVHILETLSNVCYDKVSHLSENWQETNTDQVKTWKHNGSYLDKAITHIWRQQWER